MRGPIARALLRLLRLANVDDEFGLAYFIEAFAAPDFQNQIGPGRRIAAVERQRVQVHACGELFGVGAAQRLAINADRVGGAVESGNFEEVAGFFLQRAVLARRQIAAVLCAYSSAAGQMFPMEDYHLFPRHRATQLLHQE